ncbi:MAG: hypothetical protein Q8Q67_02715 [bacterium]|nr:hypothetical protein [bacterium]
MKKKGNVIIASVLGLAVFTLAGFALDASASNGNRLMRGQDASKAGKAGWSKNLNAEQQVLMESQRAEKEQERVAHRAAMTSAIESGNYDAWAATVREQMGETAPILERVNVNNFAQFAEAHSLMLQAREKFEAMGLDSEAMGMGMGKGKMKGMGQGRNHSMMNASASVAQ